MKTAGKMPTLAQARALEVLMYTQGFVGTGQRTSDGADFNRQIQGGVARVLEHLGWAQPFAVMPDDSVVSGADLAHYLGYWRTKYKITAEGRNAHARWVCAHDWNLISSPPVRP